MYPKKFWRIENCYLNGKKNQENSEKIKRDKKSRHKNHSKKIETNRRTAASSGIGESASVVVSGLGHLGKKEGQRRISLPSCWK